MLQSWNICPISYWFEDNLSNAAIHYIALSRVFDILAAYATYIRICPSYITVAYEQMMCRWERDYISTLLSLYCWLHFCRIKTEYMCDGDVSITRWEPTGETEGECMFQFSQACANLLLWLFITDTINKWWGVFTAFMIFSFEFPKGSERRMVFQRLPAPSSPLQLNKLSSVSAVVFLKHFESNCSGQQWNMMDYSVVWMW